MQHRFAGSRRLAAGCVLSIASLACPSVSAEAQEPAQVLVLYDGGGPWGKVGAEYALLLTNLLGHFPTTVRSQPVTSYSPGAMASAAATFYIGSTYDEPSYHPADSAEHKAYQAFLADAADNTRPLLWMGYNLQHLGAGLSERFGITFVENDDEEGFNRVTYKGVALDKGVVRKTYPGADVGTCRQEREGPYDCDLDLGVVQVADKARAKVLAEATATSSGRREPYAVRSGNFWYIGDIPFSYISEEDRYLVLADLLHDVLGSKHAERHLALVRLEDVDANLDPDELQSVVEILRRHHAPFGVAAIPFHRDPSRDPPGGPPRRVGLAGSALEDDLRNLVARGEASIVQHGTTHQWDGGPNPLNGVSGDDYEFYRVTENTDHSLRLVGPIPEDSGAWPTNRIAEGKAELDKAGLAAFAWEAPHYLATASVYAAAAKTYPVHWGRVTYFPDGGNALEPSGQFFPYAVRDSYGQTVLPENLGNVEPEAVNGYPTTTPEEVVARAAKARVVRDGFASFFFHPFYEPALLEKVLSGIERLGYKFVAPCSLVSACPRK
jgi:uncharacterized protein YdaL